MAKKKSKQRQTQKELYEAPYITARIGKKEYCIPRYFLQKCPQLEYRQFYSSYITLSDIHEDIGHTFVHYLYSGCYETIRSSVEDGTSDVAREYKRSVLVYQASRTYQLPALEAFARSYIERFGEELSMPEILRTTTEVFSKLPDDETWLPKYIERNLWQSLTSSTSKFDLDEIYNALGQDHHFDNFVTKMMLEILLRPQEITSQDGKTPCEQIHSQQEEWSTSGDQPPNISTNGRHYMDIPTERNPAFEQDVAYEPVPAEESLPEEPILEEPILEEAFVEEAAVDEPIVEEPPAEESLPEEPIFEEPPVDEPASAGEPLPEEPPADEPVLEEPIPDEFLPEPVPDEVLHDEPEPEPEPEPEEPIPEEPPVDEPGESPDKSLPPRVSLEDVVLYRNWARISSKKRAKRIRTLEERGLPIPEKDGLVSFSVV
ncbi:hypothetical protein N7468_006463 [Penicillium chermesinum]|uniref:Uncharacterized protein n=1 Tax=Penicillium chermesinum TaxID=63820 RepID=A0A9W9NSQ0_9EURO|nr:uncharacterized protein N7468_006463 [Penicillium chermesinum]KAJ5225238.1 hypothetical protein N7468_006463 [Penicillium chermesinum]KAJ6140546.1 hypothetical protein N7470_010342 [Penicillium chermesinum]